MRSMLFYEKIRKTEKRTELKERKLGNLNSVGRGKSPMKIRCINTFWLGSSC